jgi:hypothetical protein
VEQAWRLTGNLAADEEGAVWVAVGLHEVAVSGDHLARLAAHHHRHVVHRARGMQVVPVAAAARRFTQRCHHRLGGGEIAR